MFTYRHTGPDRFVHSRFTIASAVILMVGAALSFPVAAVAQDEEPTTIRGIRDRLTAAIQDGAAEAQAFRDRLFEGARLLVRTQQSSDDAYDSEEEAHEAFVQDLQPVWEFLNQEQRAEIFRDYIRHYWGDGVAVVKAMRLLADKLNPSPTVISPKIGYGLVRSSGNPIGGPDTFSVTLEDSSRRYHHVTNLPERAEAFSTYVQDLRTRHGLDGLFLFDISTSVHRYTGPDTEYDLRTTTNRIADNFPEPSGLVFRSPVGRHPYTVNPITSIKRSSVRYYLLDFYDDLDSSRWITGTFDYDERMCRNVISGPALDVFEVDGSTSGCEFVSAREAHRGETLQSVLDLDQAIDEAVAAASGSEGSQGSEGGSAFEELGRQILRHRLLSAGWTLAEVLPPSSTASDAFHGSRDVVDPQVDERYLKEVVESTVESVARITAGNELGSGFYVDIDRVSQPAKETDGDSEALARPKSPWIITNYHLIADDNNRLQSYILKLDWPGLEVQGASGVVAGYDTRRDLALLHTTACRQPLKLMEAGTSAKVGDEVIVIGYPQGWELKASVTWGRIGAELDRLSGFHALPFRALQYDAATTGGNSGGPVVHASGVAGVHAQGVLGRRETDSIEGFAYGVDHREVWRFLENLRSQGLFDNTELFACE